MQGYGYFKDPEDKNHLVIDEYAAEIVRMIFNMKIDGYSAKNIAARLNEMGVLIPAEYKERVDLIIVQVLWQEKSQNGMYLPF